MIKASELRIGNLYIDADNNENCVEELDCVSIVGKFGYGDLTDYETAKPIPLTEQVLVDFGLKLVEDLGDQKYYEVNQKDNIGVCLDHDEIMIYHKALGGIIPLIYDEKYFQFTHQLQNIYFALTGKELIKKQ